MNHLRHWVAFTVFGALSNIVHAQTSENYVDSVNAWRGRAETSLRRDLGWLTLAGRWELKEGSQTLGTAQSNDIVFPEGTAPSSLGTVRVGPTGATLTLASGVQFASKRAENAAADVMDLQGDVPLDTSLDPQKWIHRERLSLVVFKRPDGKHILRIADRESTVRKTFAGRQWYAVDEQYKLKAKFRPAAVGKKIPIVNVLGETSLEAVAGVVEFQLQGRRYQLEALGEPDDKELFIIMRDGTSGRGTYPPSRFLVVSRPVAGSSQTLIDFNKAYNPPCAFSAFTSCPLPPAQNELKVAIVAGERFSR